MIPLGPFDLIHLIAKGGMGQVWEGARRASGEPVAVKLLTRASLRRQQSIAAFRGEVRAMAGLSHPSIMVVHDHGLVPPMAARLSNGALPQGSPYIVMDLVTGGTLAPWCGRLGWSRARNALLNLLDALAHAHARGVIHRDIKPDNVLVSGASRGTMALRLTDFGIAHVVGDRGVIAGGTPPYTAPEQYDRERHRLGPWTDLYAVGRLALALVWGHPMAIPEALERRRVPLGFGPWVARLLQPDPADRLQRAADAALGLFELDPPDEDSSEAARASLPQVPVLTTSLVIPDGDWLRLQSPMSSPLDTLPEIPPEPPPRPQTEPKPVVVAGRPTPPGPRRVPRPPEDWRRPQLEPPRRPLAGVGLGLYGLRSLPLAGRIAERDKLWSALKEVAADRQPKVLLVSGAAGLGKSRLAAWLAERAHELGAASAVTALHGERPGPAHGLVPGLHRALLTSRLSDVRLSRQLHTHLGPPKPGEEEAREQIVELLEGAAQADEQGTPERRYPAIAAALGALSGERVVLTLAEDIQWGAETLRFVRWLLGGPASEDLAALILLTLEPDALATQPEARALIEQIEASPFAERLELRRLPMMDHRALVEDLLGLEPRLASQVTRRTGGDPHFAVQLVGDWVRRGQLRSGRQGFALVDPQAAELPEQLSALWTARVEEVLGALPEPQAVAVEIAAALGQEVRGAEWRRSCAAAGVEPAPELVEDLITGRLARPLGIIDPDEAWSFAHPALVETIEDRAAAAGRLEAHHAACAAVLREGGADPERLGRHLLKAGLRREAAPQLLSAAAQRLRSGDLHLAEGLLADVEELLTREPLASDTDLRCRLLLLDAERLRFQGRLDEAEARAREALERGRSEGRSAVEASALWELGRQAFVAGDLVQARSRLIEAERWARSIGDLHQQARSSAELAVVLRRLGDLEGAATSYVQAQHGYRALGDDLGVAYGHFGLGEVARARRAPDEARAHLIAAWRIFRDRGSRRGIGDAMNSLGELERQTGRLEDAERCYREALEHLRAIGSPMALGPEANLGLVLIERGQPDQARRALERVAAELERRNMLLFLGNVSAYLTACCAAQQDWEATAAHLDRARQRLGEQVEVDVARMSTLAGRRCLEAGQRALAEGLLELAVDQWRRLDQPRALEEARALLARAR